MRFVTSGRLAPNSSHQFPPTETNRVNPLKEHLTWESESHGN